MSTLQLEFEWEAPGAARGPELRATWARLHIAVDGQVVTRVAEQPGQSIRDAIYVPLYPLAEWIVANWWALQFEFASPVRAAANGFVHRHNLSTASEGFALPRMEIRPEGTRVLVVWSAVELPRARVTFLAQGAAYVERDELDATLRTFVRAVVKPLDDQGVGETPLAEEWAAVCAADAEERQFCRAAALLGWDPYSLGEREAHALIEAAERLPTDVLDEFLGIADQTKLKQQSELIGEIIEKAQRAKVRLKPLEKLRERPLAIARQHAPWEQGYELARAFREHFNARANIQTVEQLGQAMGIDSAAWRRTVRPSVDGLDFLSGLVAVNQHGTPSFFTRGADKPARTFALCRTLGEFLAAPDQQAALATAAYSERQKRNRAFAAELVAPADQLRRSIASPLVFAEEIQALAAGLGTSEYVVRHQIENHRIARIASGWEPVSV
jgi:hypothetical protein